MTDPRTRSYSWADPLALAAKAREMTGLDFIQAIIRGDLPQPPIAQTLGFRLVEAREGWAAFELTPAEFQYNPIGVVHGGVGATLLDSALGCAVQAALPAGKAYTTVQLNVHMVRAITTDSPTIRAEAQVVHAGRQLATAEGRCTDAEGRVYLHGTTTCLIFPLPG